MDEEKFEQYTSNGKKIIACITVGNEKYYMDENRDIYEKLGNAYIEVTDTNIISKVKEVLNMPSKDEVMY